ncbi:MAG: SpoIIE family protein phosphatase [Salinivirgaceae bacterium]|nr:SpoIIE family protein phosphatase [Salinivirgaceae bacterium]
MRLKYLFVLLGAFLFALPQYAYSQSENEEDEEYVDPAQPKIDSLLNLITPNSPDSLKAKNYYQIAEISNSLENKIKYANLSLGLCKDTDYHLLAGNNYLLGYAYFWTGESWKSISAYQKSIGYSKKNSDVSILAKAYLGTSSVYEDMSNLDSAVSYVNRALEIFTRQNDTVSITFCYNSMGRIYGNRDLVENAVFYFSKALKLDSLSGNRLGYARNLCNLAQMMQGGWGSDYLTAKNYIAKAVPIFDSIGNHNRYIAYNLLANVYIQLAQKTGEKKYADSCLFYNKKSEPLYEITGRASDYRDYIYTYVQYLVFYKNYNKAIEAILGLASTFNDETAPVDYKNFHTNLKEVYYMMGDYKNAYEHLKKSYEYDKANLNDSTMEALSNAKAQQAVMIEKLEHEKAEAVLTAEKSRMQVIIISLGVGLALVLIVIGLVVRVLVIKKRANAELLEKNTILSEQKEEIREQRDEIMAQRDHIEEQRDTIKAQSDEIQASINYAQRIQRALLTPEETISRVFSDHFLLYKPRNVVSGDYYWVGQFGDNKVCIVADCTGHGVPGGFMSVLGMSNLNHIVAQNISPDEILNRLRESIISNLRQKDDAPAIIKDEREIDYSLDRISDGMDVAAYVVNERLMKLSYAGANNSLVLIRGSESHVLKADRMPVGIYARMAPFQCKTMDLQRGDCIYTFSDGFQDQFGGCDDCKFTGHRLRELLLEIHERPMAEQKEILNREYEQWRGPASNQTDDVVIMGVRI